MIKSNFVATRTVEQIASLMEVHRKWENYLFIHVHFAQGGRRTVLQAFFDGEESIVVGEEDRGEGGIRADPYCTVSIRHLQRAYRVCPDPSLDEQLTGC